MSSATPASVVRANLGPHRPPPGVELRAALDGLFTRAGTSRIVDLDTRPMPYASSFAIAEVDVRLADGRTVALVCKDTGLAAMLPEARRIKPRFLYDPLREIATYEWILTPFGMGAPCFYGSAVDRRRGRYWLFLERVGVPITEVGDFAVWQQACGWLARMHSRFAREPGLARAVAHVPLMRYDRAHARYWMDRARENLQADSSQPRLVRRRVASLALQYERVLDETEAQPSGFVHGEFFASNVLVQTEAGRPCVHPVDWEVAGIGPTLMDLAAFTAGWAEERRVELVDSYRSVMSDEQGTSVPYDEFMRALDCCRLHLAVQRVGWARQWTPPANHRQDWLNQAFDIADRLGF
jgi:hypothetical protein